MSGVEVKFKYLSSNLMKEVLEGSHGRDAELRMKDRSDQGLDACCILIF